MAYPFSPAACRMCKDLARRQIEKHFPGPERPPLPPAVSPWNTKIEPRTRQKFNNVGEYPGQK
jgi:hypothetical protein